MLKKILNLDGAKELNQNEKKNINGGIVQCRFDSDCGTDTACTNGTYTDYKCNRETGQCERWLALC